MAERKEEKKEAEEGEAEAKPKSKKKLILIVVGLVVILAGAGVPLMMMGGGEKAEHAEDAHTEEVKHYATAPLDTFIVNLSANSAFLKVALLLEYGPEIIAKASHHGEAGGEAEGGGHSGGGEAPAGLPGIMSEREPMIRDSVIRVLSSKKAEDVLTLDGKDRLKEELIEAINEAIGLDEGPVVNIYFTEFVVQ